MSQGRIWTAVLVLGTLVPTAHATPLDPGAFTSLAPSLAPGADLAVDTDTLQMSGGATHTGVIDGGVAVFTFDEVLLDGVVLVVTGSRPIALLSQGDLVLSNAASVQLLPTAAQGNAGGGDGGGIGADGAGAGPGLGAVAGGGGGGGHCGAGGTSTAAGGAATGDLSLALTGGSGGGGGDGAVGGAGAGAVELGALGQLQIDGSSTILATGAAGASGPSGGGGGGGGGIRLHGVGGSFGGTIAARGGAGGTAATGTGGAGGGGGCVWVRGLSSATGTALIAGGAGTTPGAPGTLTADLDQDADGFAASIDCDDGDPDIFPGAPERCNGIDDSCDLALHPSELDTDGDGYASCVIDPGGWLGDPTVIGGEDCDDTEGTSYPDAEEICDGLDNNCDGTPGPTEIDDDGDGYVICTLDGGGWDGPGVIVGGDDCDDAAPGVSPGAVDLCGNGIDDDCDDLGAHGPNAGLAGGWLDDDGDGLDHSIEQGLGTDDCDADSDDDGLDDDEELLLSTSPLEPDSDGDGLDDGVEVLVTGTSPTSEDSDGDGLSDGSEIGSILDPTDTDGDTQIDALDPDDDGDGVPTTLEAPLGDSDGDGDDDYLDTDDDGDGVLTADEAPLGDSDSDGDDDYLDTDDDDDTIPTMLEALDLPQDPDDDDVPNWLDDDSDGDGWSDAHEGRLHSDGDGVPDYLDDDSDGDGVPDDDELGSELLPLAARDSDGDGDEDRIDPDDDGDGVLTSTELPLGDSDGDGDDDYLDTDDDDDGVPTADEAPLGDSDGDGDDDYLDPDDDGDGVLTSTEAPLGDSDGDGDDDYLDTDDDDDGVPTDVEEPAGTDRLSIDSDGDGFLDGEEWLNWLRTSPDVDCLAATTDCDDRLGGTTGGSLSDPWDRDADGEINALDGDDDGDGLASLIEGGAHSECLSTYPGDGIPDYLDDDSDDDGIADRDEFAGDSDGDGLVDRLDCTDDGCLGDGDSDGVPNCRETELTGDPGAQSSPDFDGDGVTDGLEVGDPGCLVPQGPCTPADTDNDGVPNIADTDDDGDAFHTTFELGLCPNGGDPTLEYDDGWSLRCGNGALYEPRNTDADVGGWLPLQPDDLPDYLDADDDGDGVPSFDEGAGDADGDDTPNWLDPNDVDGPDADADLDGMSNETEAELGLDPYDDDSDNDGVADLSEVGDPGNPLDTDDDGLIDALDDDDDDDGLPTVLEGVGDSDGDGVPNYLDTDSDDDGTPDAAEGLTDYDCDRIPAFLDAQDSEGPCTEVPLPQQRYERGSCSASGRPVGGLLVLLLTASLARRRRAAAR